MKKLNKQINKISSTIEWKVNTAGLLNEVLMNPGTSILTKPLKIFSMILSEVGTRCAELNDPVLNYLMCRLAIYGEADQYSKDYNKAIVDKVEQEYKDYLKKEK